MPPLPPFEVFLAIMVVIFLGIGLHEYAHCKMADAAGDPTPAAYGRVTLNLTKHFDTMGTIMMIISSISGFGLGWGKPAPMDPRKMRNPRWDLFVAVAAGPISNILQAGIWALILRLVLLGAPDLLSSLFLSSLLLFGVQINLGIAMFNLIPLGPLDGHWLVGLMIPEKARYHWFKWNRSFGTLGLFGLIIVLQMIRQNGGPDIISMVVGPPLYFLFRLFTGINTPLG